jgi:DNA-binding MarR family transcriptional regulator
LSKKSSAHLAELMMDIIPKTTQKIREELRRVRGDRLTVTQFRVLAAVNRGLCRNKDICELLGVSEAAISRMIDVLVQDGLIKKGVDKDDRRQTVLSLTSEGQKLHSVTKAEARTRLKSKLDALSSEDIESMIKGLEILQQNINLLDEEKS